MPAGHRPIARATDAAGAAADPIRSFRASWRIPDGSDRKNDLRPPS